MANLKRRDTFTWFDYSRKLRGLTGSRPARRRPTGPAALSEEGSDDSDTVTDTSVTSSAEPVQPQCERLQGGLLDRREVKRITRTFSQPESCRGPGVPLRRRSAASQRSSSSSDSAVSDSGSDMEVDAGSGTTDIPPLPGTRAAEMRKTHTRTSSFPEVRVRGRPSASNTLPRPQTQLSVDGTRPPAAGSRHNSFEDADNDLDPVKRTRVNSFTDGVKNAMKDKFNNVKTRVRRISSHSRPASGAAAEKPPKVRRPTSDIINEDSDGKSEDKPVNNGGRSRRHYKPSAGDASGSEAEGADVDDLPPQPRHRVNSFSDVKNAVKEKLKNVQARARRRPRGPGSSGPPLDLKHRSLSFQNLVTPSMLVRMASSPDVSQLGLDTTPASREVTDSSRFTDDYIVKPGKGHQDWKDTRRRSARAGSDDSNDAGGSDVSGDVRDRRSRGEGELTVMTGGEGHQGTNHSDTDVMHDDTHPGISAGYHGDNDTDDEETPDNGHSAGPYVALTLLGKQVPSSPRPPDPPGGATPGSPPVDAGSDRITGPQPVNDTMNQELRNQKVAFTRMMYEKATSQFENMKAERHLSDAELHDQLRTIRRLEEALYNLTGIPAESHLANLGKRSPPPGTYPGTPPPHPGSAGPGGHHGHHYSSPLPPLPPHHTPSSAGHTHSHTSHAHVQIRRYPSGEQLHISPEGHRDSAHYHHAHHEGTTPPSTANPTPWLPGGPRQRKLDSGSDTTFGDDTPGRDVTVVRTHSDNRKRHDDDKHRSLEYKKQRSRSEKRPRVKSGDLNTRRRRMMRKATSLPTTVAESDPGLAHSPSPGKDGWAPDGHDSNDDYGDEGVPAIIPMMQQSEGGPYSPNQVNIMGAEDDFSDDEEGQSADQAGAAPPPAVKAADQEVEEHGPFSDLNALKRKWSHLAVFLNYLISNSDPSPLLFYLVTEDYAKGTIKEMKKWAYEIHSTFLVNKAPLRVMVDEAIVANIDNVLLTKADKVDAIQSAFGLARHHAQNEISELLADFRNKCALGLGSLYGTHEISPKDTMERSKELHLVEKYLVPHFERLLDNEEASDRNQAMAYALATVLKQMGCTSGKVGAALERCPSFVAKDKKTFKLKTNKRQIMVRDHSFMPMSYYTSAYCHHCTGVIWGIGNQGYHCQVCETNVHKQCVEAIKESCSAGQKEARKKTKRTSSIMNIIRKPSVVTQPQISSKDSQRWSDDGYTSPGSSSTSLRLPREDDEDDTSVPERDHLAVSTPVVVPKSPLLSRVRKGSSGSPPGSVFYTSPPTPTASSFRDPILDRLQGRVTQMVEQLSPRGGGGDEARSPGTPPRSRSPDPGQDGDNDTRKHVVRSESLKGSKEAKSKTVRRSQSDLHVDDPSVKNVLNQSGSDTSIAGSLESPSNSSERLADREAYLRQAREDDSDLDVENELPPLSASLPADLVKKLKPKEKKRQDVMNELLHTERTHVRTIKVMQRVFYNHMMAEGISLDLARLLFPNIEELVQCHCSLSNSFKARKKENPQVSHVGDLLLNRFSGEAGEKFKTACATFCRSQSHALEMLRVRQRKDQKLAMFLQEASVNPLCRRLELKDLIPTVMQRLTKYPLLMENLLKYTQAGTEEHGDLNKALVCSRDILSYVNEAVKEFENQQRLRDIQKRLDKKSFENSNLPIVSEFKNLDLTQHTMVYNGQLTWRIGRTKQIELHVVLLEDILVLLQRQDDKYVLKCSTTVVSGREDAKYTHSPVLKLSNVLARNVAVDKRAFFLVCTSDIGPQIYELHAMSAEEKNKWLRYISEAVDAYKERTQKQPHKTPGLPAALGDDKGRVRKESKEEPSDGEGLEAYRSSSVDSLEKATVTTNQADLIQPTEVVISDTVLEERAQPVLSPREMLKRKDEVIRQSLDEKDRLVAEILHVPPAEYSTIAEMASDIEGDKDMRELVLGATYQMSRLTALVNDSLTVPADDEADVPEEPVSPAPGASASRSVTLPAASVLTVTKKLSEQLTLLLSLVGDQEEQNKRLQRELEVANEQLVLARGAGPHRSPSNSFSRHSRPNSFASITSSTSEVAETPEEAQQLASSSDETGPFPASTSPADVTVTAMYDVNKLEVVEADDANHNVDATLTLTTTPTDANSNRPPDDEGSAT